jgi:hypothetical protein
MTRSEPWAPMARVVRHGREQEPVIVIDDYARDPEQLIDEASGLDYGPIGPNFPGVRAHAPGPLAASIRSSVEDLMLKTFGLAALPNRMECYFSLVTTPPGELRLIQRLPHFDGTGRSRLAMLLHLSRAERGGTAFFRHRSSGFETIDAARLAVYNRRVNAELLAQGREPEGYIAGDTAIYEQIAHYPARFNRMLIYRGNTLHSADVPDDLPLTDDPRRGRFSINSFLWLDAPGQTPAGG